ncbi:hypothetical protein HZF05_14160 [Sphingomonas sp. CGMCC 1.13654]|uniref:Uncharacterized protein n=1 Tax=Sphingomonas chungangi TaxID=2683589 RepID=A0A838LCL4_9SPHN|nr:hypothetical protein [Sphingomonas chungangi]MBA2935228.1 hypothetical protein [Sphingomonas chungangi]MVW55306.1 hypothetical protein [Sphingomonas chungangi]
MDHDEAANSYDAAYYREREQQARRLADAASVPSIRAIHLQMADRYSQLVERPPKISAGQST